jgi:putative transposase
MKQKRAYQYRFYPTAEQECILAHTFGCARYVYNWALRLRTDAYYQDKKRIGYHETSAQLTKLKQQEDHAWLNEVSCVPPQQALRHLDRAFRNFFEGRAAYPTFNKKQGEQSAEYTTSAFKWDGKQLTLAIRWSRSLPDGSKLTTVTVRKDTA